MSRTTTTVAVLAGAGLALAACGDSSPSESAIEQILEEATGQDAEIDLSDGEIKVQTEEGEVRIDIDEEDGSFEMSVDGDELIDAQVDQDGEGGQINIETEDGDATIDISEDGEGSLEITGQDGETSIDVSTGGTELPEEWPDAVPAPDGLAIESSSTVATGDDVTVSLTGTADQDWIDAYGSAVESAGFSETSRMETPESSNLFYEGNGWAVAIFGTDSGDGSWNVVLSATPLPE